MNEELRRLNMHGEGHIKPKINQEMFGHFPYLL